MKSVIINLFILLNSNTLFFICYKFSDMAYPYEDSQAAYSDDETQGTHISQTQEQDPWIEAMQQQSTYLFGGPPRPLPDYTDSVLDRAETRLYAPSTSLQLGRQAGQASSSSHRPPSADNYQMPSFEQFAGGRPQFRPPPMDFSFPVPAHTGPPPVPTVQLRPPPAPQSPFQPPAAPAAVHAGGNADDNNEVGARPTRGKRRKSDVWRSMTRTEERQSDGSIKVWATCKGCEKQYRAESHRGTSHLHYLIDRCDKLENGLLLPAEGAAGQAGPSSGVLYDEQVHRQALARFIAVQGLELNFADNPSWEELIQLSFLKDYQRPSRTTTRADLVKWYEWKRTELIGGFVEASQRVALTSDIWSGGASHDYIGVCCHYIDRDWNVEKRIIGFRAMEEGHSGEMIAQEILAVVNDYGVTGRVISITMDNASANDRAINILRGALNPISYPYFFHSRCVTHILNLVVQDGMKELDSTLKDIRDAVIYLNGSHQREARWRRACELNGLRPKMIANDMPVRWNSTYLMLQSIIPYAESFTVWYNNERRGSQLNERHWQDAMLLCGFLQVFYEATNIFSSSLRATTPIFVHQLINMGNVFKRYKNHRRLAGAVNKMLEKFLKYFYPLPHLYAFAFLLDPRNRYKGLQSFLKVLTRQLGPDYASLVDDHAAALQEAYSVYELRFGVTSDQAPTEKTSPTSASWRLVREDLQDEEESPSSVSPSGGTEHNELNVFLNTKFTEAGSENLDLVR